MDRRSFFLAFLGLVALPRVLRRAPLPTDDVQVVSVPPVWHDYASMDPGHYSITTTNNTGTSTVWVEYDLWVPAR